MTCRNGRRADATLTVGDVRTNRFDTGPFDTKRFRAKLDLESRADDQERTGVIWGWIAGLAVIVLAIASTYPR